jgi:hypothetical protein
MKRIKRFKVFENFELHREDVISFFEDDPSIIIEEIKNVNFNNFILSKAESIKDQSYICQYIGVKKIHNLFSQESFAEFRTRHKKDIESRSYYAQFDLAERPDDSKELMIVKGTYLPKNELSSSKVKIDEGVEVIKNLTSRINIGYDMDVFLNITNFIITRGDKINDFEFELMIFENY